MININLLPPELKIKRLEAKRNATLVGFCIVAIIFVVVLAIIGQSVVSTVEAHLGAIKSDIDKNTASLNQEQELQDLALLINDRWQTTQEINEKRVFWSVVLQDLINSVPANVQFENLTVKTEKTPNFVLQGNTINEREIIKFKEKLESSAYFSNVSFKSSTLTESAPSATQPEATQKLNFTLEFDLEAKGNDVSISN